jgi:radical SAM superfamily enzyme YgiQ (UPF0313 family)
MPSVPPASPAKTVSTNAKTPRIWLCDLTYTQQTISSDVMPAAVGHIAAYTKAFLGGEADIRVFKFPQTLANALASELPPHVIGFSNYIWNCNLSAEFARVIKKGMPEVVTVMGGPNYPTNAHEQAEFLQRYRMFDFYIVKEGEVAFAKLVQSLSVHSFSPAAVPLDLPSIHRVLPDGSFHAAAVEERITELSDIPSPYLSGLMDEYFDGVMLPIIQTNRGCPFRCTFCVEGQSYYSRVSKTRSDKISRELEYIAQRMSALRKGARARSDLHIADSNFGMYKEDLEVCRAIAQMQERYGYPEYINVATGKNHKERVLEAAKLLKGALRLAGSVQSMDKVVLQNIDRSNINEQAIMDLALSASEIGANSYSEIILALPGDTVEAHLKSIRAMVEADFNTIALYQLMLLPGTDLANRESVEKWQMRTRYRVLPRCFGYFDVLGEHIDVAEIEQICVANNSLSVDDYLACRHMHLVINVFYNDGVFKEALRLLKMLRLPRYDWLERIWRYRDNVAFNNLVAEFLKETSDELWNDPEELRAFTKSREHIDRYIAGELGANLIFKYKSLALVRHANALAEIASVTLAEYLRDAGASDAVLRFAGELIEYGRLRMTDIFENGDAVHRGTFNYDLIAFSGTVRPAGIDAFTLPEPTEYCFEMSAEQRQTVADYTAIYGASVMGLSRILSKVYVRRLFRQPKLAGVATLEGSRTEMITGDGQLTGLNQFS